MSTLTPDMQDALSGVAPLVFAAVEILLIGGDAIRLVDGAGFASFGGNVFSGLDPTYGTLGSVGQYSDGVDNQSPSLTLTLLTPTNEAMATIADPAMQGSPVNIWIGCMIGGAVVADPELVFAGWLDVPTNKIGQNTRNLELVLVSEFDRLFMEDEGVRLNNGSHQQFWPGELGLQYVAALQPDLPWGAAAPRPVLAVAA